MKFACGLSAIAAFAPLLTAAAPTPNVTISSFQSKCLAFRPENFIKNSTRTILSYVPAGTTLQLTDNVASCGRPSQLVDTNLCRIALSIPTSNRSSITFELWLPEVWSGRFLGTGNGGIDGCVKYEDLAYATPHGFATFGTNNGHNGTTAIDFYQNTDVGIDFAWRSLHTATVSGKLLTQKFYGKSYTKSYYIGCSLGGRQGIKASEMFPDDFDGIVAGSPAVDFNNLVSWRASFYPITGPSTSPDFITAPMWINLIHNEVLKQCDGIDGAIDGIIEDPTLCHFNPSTLKCNGTASASCLTDIQIGQVNKIFSPFLNTDGSLIYPAMQPGSEVATVAKLYAGIPFSYSNEWFKYVVDNPSWQAANFNTTDAVAAEALNPANIRTWPDNLNKFHQKNGKIITYHGQQDNQITSFNSIRFYDHLNAQRVPANPLDQYYRFFRISGMNHCSTGPGAWVFGQGGAAAAAGVPYTPSGNVLSAIVDWVENNNAPDTIEGTKFVNDNITQGVDFTRKHCRYPLRNTFKGGDYKLPCNWQCE